MPRTSLPRARAALRRRVGSLADLPPTEQRRARLLAWVLIALTLLAVVALVVTLSVNSAESARRTAYAPLIVVTAAILLSALALDLSGRYRPAAALTVGCAFVAPWVCVAVDASILSGDSVPLLYVVVPIVLSGALLSTAVTVLLAAVQIAALAVLPVLAPTIRSANWPSLMILVLMVATVTIVAGVLQRKDADQLCRQNRLLEERERFLREQSTRDHLTGVFNRRYLEETLHRELRRAERGGGPVAVIMVDIDHFKRFNSHYGHSVGDAVLRDLGAFLRTHVREADIACRYGGDEFTLVLPGASIEVARGRAEELRTQVKLLETSLPDERGVTLSLGVCAFPEHGDTGERLLAVGDAALYRAKSEGRDRVAVAACT